MRFECEHGAKQFAKYSAIPEKLTPEQRIFLRSIRRKFLDAAVNGKDIAAFAVGIDLKEHSELCQKQK